MTKGQQGMAWTAGAVIVGIILWLLLRGKSQPVDNSAPYYMSYNAPGGKTYDGGASGLPTIPAMSGSDCGCTSSAGGSFFTSLNDMLQSFMQGAQGAFSSYVDNVYSTVPDYAQQYFNNPVGAGMAVSSQRILTSAG